MDSVTAHKVVSGVHLIRGNCASRLKYEVEYNLKRGTTDNSYILQVKSGFQWLVGVGGLSTS